MSRSSEARANAATPRGVTGSQAKVDSAMARTKTILAERAADESFKTGTR
jgi:hypothetical protein